MDHLAQDPHGIWKALVAAAVLGTDRAGPLPPMAQELSIPAPNPAVPEAELLSAAAALAVYLRAGLAPAVDDHPPAAPAPPAGRVPNRAAADHLQTMLSEPRSPILFEWCERAHQTGHVVPPRFLPEMLRRAERDPALRPLLRPILGDRGRWLAEQNAAWRDLFVHETPDPAEAWQIGTLEQRVQLLRSLRPTDQVRASVLIESTWDQDPPEDRAKFLEALQPQAAPADEALLERALGDRRKAVRDAAAAVLSCLPASAYAQRMTRRLSALITCTPASRGLLRKKAAQLNVTLPPEPDANAKRDGLSAAARQGLGPQAAMLADIVAATPLDFWKSTSLSPAELIDAAVAGEFGRALLDGWLRAAQRQRSPDWAEAIVRALLCAKEPAFPLASVLMPLLAVLPPDRAEATALRVLAELGPQALDLLACCPFPWGPELSSAALAGARRRDPDTLRHWLSDVAAVRMHPSLAPAAAVDWPGDVAPAARRHLDQFIHTLQFRHDMHKELAS
jgi:hypothetical protein